MTTVNANEIALGIESFGDDDAPLVLLAGGTTMLSWPDALCERLPARGGGGGGADLGDRGRRAGGGGRVGAYAWRDRGERRAAPPGAPAYTMRDLTADAAALADALA